MLSLLFLSTAFLSQPQFYVALLNHQGVVFYHDDGMTVCSQTAKSLNEFIQFRIVQPGRGFVQQKQSFMMVNPLKRFRQIQPVSLPGRKRLDRLPQFKTFQTDVNQRRQGQLNAAKVPEKRKGVSNRQTKNFRCVQTAKSGQ